MALVTGLLLLVSNQFADDMMASPVIIRGYPRFEKLEPRIRSAASLANALVQNLAYRVGVALRSEPLGNVEAIHTHKMSRFCDILHEYARLRRFIRKINFGERTKFALILLSVRNL
jgi:hypothetical protein